MRMDRKEAELVGVRKQGWLEGDEGKFFVGEFPSQEPGFRDSF